MKYPNNILTIYFCIRIIICEKEGIMNERDLENIEKAIIAGLEVAVKELAGFKPDIDNPVELKIIRTMNLVRHRVHSEIRKGHLTGVY